MTQAAFSHMFKLRRKFGEPKVLIYADDPNPSTEMAHLHPDTGTSAAADLHSPPFMVAITLLWLLPTSGVWQLSCNVQAAVCNLENLNTNIC